MSRSFANLLDLSKENPMFTKGGGVANLGLRRSPMPRSMTVGGLSLERDDEIGGSVTSDAPSSIASERLILVANMLPVEGGKMGGQWSFKWDQSSLQWQLNDGLAKDREVLHVGCLKVEVEPHEEDEVAAVLAKFNCVPAFIPQDVRTKFYHGFCKQYLWPLFHYNLPLSRDHGGRFDPNLWQAYVSANKIIADKLNEVIDPETDYVWVHDYHLMALPTFLRRRFYKLRLGFFLHSPFPSSEIYRTCPKRDELLRALLNADLIGFHTFDYARHFLSCCSRMLGLGFESKRGYIGIEYYGRIVGIKIMPVGVHLPQLVQGLKKSDTEWRIGELKSQFEGKNVLLGVDDVDVFKGLGLKLLAFESLLKTHPEWRGKVVLVQITSPARTVGRDVMEVTEEVNEIRDRINEEFGPQGYEANVPPVILLERHVPLYERIAFYTIAQCCVVTAVRDGMNLTPYEYVVCRQGTDPAPPQEALGNRSLASQESIRKKSMLVVSEFIGCSPSLSGAIRINPWNIEAVAEAMNTAMITSEAEQFLRHEKHFRYVSTHTVAYWAESFMSDLERTCREHSRLRCYGIGFGHGFRVVALDPNFRKLNIDQIAASYARSKSRAILLDYDGTMMSQSTINRTPSPEVISVLQTLCADENNVVFIVSGRTRVTLAEWFAPVERLGLAAEHGYFFRWHRDEEWHTLVPPLTSTWQEVAFPIMEQYKESTDGSFIENKESALVWHHRDADPDFGSWQAKELLDHLESVLSGQPVAVTSGNHIVEAKPQGVSKGLVVEQILSSMVSGEKDTLRPPDFVLCIGDDRSDEDMFERIGSIVSQPPHPPSDIFACTVGQKPSKAKYYLDDTVEVLQMLQGLAQASTEASQPLVPMDATSDYDVEE
eukprot:TRINITY_DN1327_c0_g1_i1.p1 TRINITY_DN1327_c0_g1~~TRINITY_DN1327_c0_g1_i1.p1  ORF type:complete len:882 (+),score=159.40 TRINITY_DN1327_c0_g1_i1:458-3103(+)